MFAYVEIIDEQGKTTYNYVNFEISDGLLSIKPLKGMLPVHLSVIPISQIKDISENEPELFIPFKKVVSFHVFQKLTTFDLAYYVLRL